MKTTITKEQRQLLREIYNSTKFKVGVHLYGGSYYYGTIIKVFKKYVLVSGSPNVKMSKIRAMKMIK